MFVETANLHLPQAEIVKAYRYYLRWIKLNNPGYPPCVKPHEITPITIDHIYWLAIEAGYGKYPSQ